MAKVKKIIAAVDLPELKIIKGEICPKDASPVFVERYLRRSWLKVVEIDVPDDEKPAVDQPKAKAKRGRKANQ